ncbi:MAG: HD domain-containing protein [Candidatus Saccharibacteria bacterium]|nr:HD domain-containing protein [Candidatus Saccharibacteria bacterium]
MREGVPTPDIENPDISQALERRNANPTRTLAIGRLALQTDSYVEDLADVTRIPRRKNGERENNVIHSFKLATLAPNIAHALGLKLDLNLMRHFGLVHDALEIETGDVATFNVSPEEQKEKERREKAALKKLCKRLPILEAEALETYERQDTPEARFVRMVDKLLPTVLDFTGQGTRVVEEDFGTSSVEELRASHDKLAAKLRTMFENEFPLEVEQAYAVLAYLFENKYELERQARKARLPERPQQLTEVERKWRINPENIPFALGEMRCAELKQGYLATGGDGSEVRIRSFGDDKRFELTMKSDGTIVRGEQTIKLTKEAFEALWPLTEGSRIEKTRYYIPLKDEHGRELTIELDIYHGHLEGLATAEIEFSGREADALVQANTFKAPAWFGKDISEDKRFKNHSLANRTDLNFVSLGD